MISFLQGDVFDKLKELDDNSIDCVVTSPPYWGLRDYGVPGQLGLEPTYQEHIKNIVEFFRIMKPKLKDSATVWLNYGDSYAATINGTKVKDQIKNKVQFAGKYLIKGDDRTFRDKPFSTIQGFLKPKDLVMIPNRIAIALQEDGWWIRSEIIWHKPNPMPESVRDRPTSAHEKIWLITKSKKYYYDADSIREPLASTSLIRLNQDIKNQKGSTRGNGGMKSNGNMKAVRPYRVLDADQRPEFVETRDLPEHNELREYLSLNRKNKNITIDEVGDFNLVFDDLFVQLNDLATNVLSCIGLTIGLTKDYFSPWVIKGNSLLRMIHYPPSDNDNIYRAREHADINLITLLIGAEERGLEVKNKDNSWIQISANKNDIVCNIGDMLQLVTEGKLKSTPHRVVKYKNEEPKSRYSIPFFLHPSPDIMLKSVFNSEDKGVLAHDFLDERLRAIKLY